MQVLTVMMLIAVLTYVAFKAKKKQEDELEDNEVSAGKEDDIYSSLVVEPIEITVGKNLIPLAGGNDSLFMDRIIAFRKQYALEAGFVIPKVRVKDNKKLAPNAYEIKIYGAKVGSGEILVDHTLAINPGNVAHEIEGITTKDPTYGLPAVWVAELQKGAARTAGYTLVEPVTVLMTHISEILRQQSASLLTRRETERLLYRMKNSDPGLIEELIPSVLSYSDVQKVLQNLLREKVPIRNMEVILEILVDYGKQNKDTDYLTELVRQKLAPVICQTLFSEKGDLYVLTLDPSIEQSLASGMRADIKQANGLILEPKFAEQVLAKLVTQVEKMMGANLMPVLLCAPEMRRHLRGFTERVVPHMVVLSMLEVPSSVSLKSFGMVSI